MLDAAEGRASDVGSGRRHMSLSARHIKCGTRGRGFLAKLWVEAVNLLPKTIALVHVFQRGKIGLADVERDLICTRTADDPNCALVHDPLDGGASNQRG